MPYHVILAGSAVLEVSRSGPPLHLGAGDIVMLPHGSGHVLHDGSGKSPAPARNRGDLNLTFSDNTGDGERLEMLCGSFFLAPPHDRFVRDYLPTNFVVRTATRDESHGSETSAQLTGLLALMRTESNASHLGGNAMLNALSSALFTLTLRMASESKDAPTGLLALVGQPRLAPALTAMFSEPARPWTLPELAGLCNMSRATLIRHFQDKVGRSANDLLTAIRMTLAANELKKTNASTETVAETVGYQSVAAFRRAFSQHMGMTPGEWRRTHLHQTE
jgi:AraC family transcriptional activator of mtrCDE